MLKIYHAKDQKELDQFISIKMKTWNGWTFNQVDHNPALFPAQFIIYVDAKIKLATIHLLH